MGIAQIIAIIWLSILFFRGICEYGQATTNLFYEYKKSSAIFSMVAVLLWTAILYFGGFFSQ